MGLVARARFRANRDLAESRELSGVERLSGKSMRTPRLLLIWGFVTGIAAGLASAAPPSYLEPVGEASDKASFTFKIDVPALVLSNLPDGSSQIRIDGFAGHQSRPGVPDLPFTVVHLPSRPASRRDSSRKASSKIA